MSWFLICVSSLCCSLKGVACWICWKILRAFLILALGWISLKNDVDNFRIAVTYPVTTTPFNCLQLNYIASPSSICCYWCFLCQFWRPIYFFCSCFLCICCCHCIGAHLIILVLYCVFQWLQCGIGNVAVLAIIFVGFGLFVWFLSWSIWYWFDLLWLSFYWAFYVAFCFGLIFGSIWTLLMYFNSMGFVNANNVY